MVTSGRSFMFSVLLRKLHIPAIWDKSGENFSYLSEIFKPLKAAQGVGYLRREPVLPCSQSTWNYLMNRHSNHFRQEAAVSFPILSSTPGATELLIAGNKGNFLPMWLPLTFLGKVKKAKRKEREENVNLLQSQ